jgi:hypothetical protein
VISRSRTLPCLDARRILDKAFDHPTTEELTVPTVAKYVDVSDEQMRAIAGFIRKWIDKTGVTYEEFADRYNALRKKRYAPGTVVPMDRFRVLAFLNLARESSSTRVARVLRCREADLISLVTGVPVEVLLGQESESSQRLIDATASTKDAAAFLELMRSEQAKTQELIGWAEFLPCSLETPEFMHAHHEALFSKCPEDVMVWDSIGNTRRNELLSTSVKRGWLMTQLNFLSDLRKISLGENEYVSISNDVRAACLENLIGLLSDRTVNVRMLIADDESDPEARALKSDLRGHDSVVTWDEKLVILRDRFGINSFSHKLRYTKYWRGMQQEFIALAKFSDPEQVVRVIRDLKDAIPIETNKFKQVHAKKEIESNQWARQQ